jgi:hypothetical protein
MLAEIERGVLAQKGIGVVAPVAADTEAGESKDAKAESEGRAKAAQRPRPRA